MSYIPTVREKTVTMPFSDEERANYYWEGNLNEKNTQFLRAYDFGVEDSMAIINDCEMFAIESDIDVRPSDIKTVMEAFAEWYRERMETYRDGYVVGMLDNQEDTDVLR